MRAMPEKCDLPKKMLLMLAFFFKNPLGVKNAFFNAGTIAQLPDCPIARQIFLSKISLEVLVIQD